MLGALYSVARVVGGELLLLTWGICAAIYLAVGFVRRKGRGRKGRYQLLSGLLVSEVLVDVFPRGRIPQLGCGQRLRGGGVARSTAGGLRDHHRFWKGRGIKSGHFR